MFLTGNWTLTPNLWDKLKNSRRKAAIFPTKILHMKSSSVLSVMEWSSTSISPTPSDSCSAIYCLVHWGFTGNKERCVIRPSSSCRNSSYVILPVLKLVCGRSFLPDFLDNLKWARLHRKNLFVFFLKGFSFSHFPCLLGRRKVCFIGSYVCSLFSTPNLNVHSLGTYTFPNQKALSLSYLYSPSLGLMKKVHVSFLPPYRFSTPLLKFCSGPRRLPPFLLFFSSVYGRSLQCFTHGLQSF